LIVNENIELELKDRFNKVLDLIKEKKINQAKEILNQIVYESRENNIQDVLGRARVQLSLLKWREQGIGLNDLDIYRFNPKQEIELKKKEKFSLKNLYYLSLRRIDINNLFGLFTYKFIEFQQSQNVIIIFGPNGSGKTTILKIIDFFRTGDFINLAKIKFESIKFYFDRINKDKQNGFLNIEVKKIKKRKSNKDLKIIFYDNSEENKISFKINTTFVTNVLMEIPLKSKESIKRFILDDKLNNYKIYIPYNKKEYFALKRKRNEFAHNYYYYSPSSSDDKKFIKEFRKIKDSFSCFFIPAQRLDLGGLKEKEKKKRKITSVIESKSEFLRKLINKSLNEYIKKSQTLDKSLISRIIKSIDSNKNYNYNDIFKELTELEKTQELYAKAGLDISDVTGDVNLRDSLDKSKNWDDARKQILYKILKDVIINDGWEKLNVFSNLYKKISLFQSIVNKHFHNKKLEINYNIGFAVRSVEPLEILDINKLSSGEMNLIILFFNLIFEAKPNTLILIDEPEISLHVEWQIRFIDNLLRFKTSEIDGLKNLRFIIATHSPQIIHHHDDLTIELGFENES